MVACDVSSLGRASREGCLASARVTSERTTGLGWCVSGWGVLPQQEVARKRTSLGRASREGCLASARATCERTSLGASRTGRCLGRGWPVRAPVSGGASRAGCLASARVARKVSNLGRASRGGVLPQRG
eukprot:8824982-Pyramimonas_sp.AAC.1